MKRVWILTGLACVLLLGILSCAQKPKAYDLNLKFSGMNPTQGQIFVVNVRDKANDSLVAGKAVAAVPGDTFEIAVGTVLQQGHSYRVDYFADMNRNGQYDPPPADQAWRMELDGIEKDTTITVSYNTNFVNVDSMQIPSGLPTPSAPTDSAMMNPDSATQVPDSTGRQADSIGQPTDTTGQTAPGTQPR